MGELATLLDLPNLIHNYKTNGEIPGFHKAYLERKAQELVNIKRWENLSDMLALLIFSLILFPNLEGFVDVAAISVFWATRIFEEDCVAALLRGAYNTLEVRYIKKRRLMLCFIQLLYQWLVVQISSNASSVKAMDKDKWSLKMVSLTKK